MGCDSGSVLTEVGSSAGWDSSLFRDSEKLPFKNNYADVVLLDNVIEHIEPDGYLSFLEELHRICKRGAIIHPNLMRNFSFIAVLP